MYKQCKYNLKCAHLQFSKSAFIYGAEQLVKTMYHLNVKVGYLDQCHRERDIGIQKLRDKIKQLEANLTQCQYERDFFKVQASWKRRNDSPAPSSGAGSSVDPICDPPGLTLPDPSLQQDWPLGILPNVCKSQPPANANSDDAQQADHADNENSDDAQQSTFLEYLDEPDLDH